MTGRIQHFRSASWQAWQIKVATDLCKRKGFRGGFGVDIYGSHQPLVSSHFRERDKMLLRAILSGGVWTGCLLGKVKKEGVPCRFCGAPDNDGHLFWDCTFPPFVELHHWGLAQDLDDPHEGSSHIFSGVLGPIQSVQRAEYWEVILALQAYSGIHIGIDNLNVLRGVAALLSQQVPRSLSPLSRMVICLPPFVPCCAYVVLTR